jgi:hypothetical protein
MNPVRQQGDTFCRRRIGFVHLQQRLARRGGMLPATKATQMPSMVRGVVAALCGRLV